MYKSILRNLEVFPIFKSSPPNLILKIPIIASKKSFGGKQTLKKRDDFIHDDP